MTEDKRCTHQNQRGYGRCLLNQGHKPMHNGAGVYYAHQYEYRGSYGNFDGYEGNVKVRHRVSNPRKPTNMPEPDNSESTEADLAEITLAAFRSEAMLWLMAGSGHTEHQIDSLRQYWEAYRNAGGKSWGR